MWTAVVVRKDFSDGELAVRVLFTKGRVTANGEVISAEPEQPQVIETFRTRVADDQWLGVRIRARLAELKQLDGVAAAVEIGTTVTEADTEEPPNEDAGRVAYRELVSKCAQLERAAARGVDVTAELDAVKQALIAEFKPGYEVAF